MKKILIVTLLALGALYIFGGKVELPKNYSLNGQTNAALTELLGEIE